MRKREIIGDYGCLMIYAFYYYLGYRFELLPDLKSIIDLDMSYLHMAMLILWTWICIISIAVMRQGLEMFDKNDKEES